MGKNTLFAVTGLAPHMITHTLWHFIVEQKVQIQQVAIITTDRGSLALHRGIPDRGFAPFLGPDGIFEKFRNEYGIDDLPCQMRIIKDRNGRRVGDVVTTADLEATAYYIMDTVRSFVLSPEDRLFCINSGGRRVMAAYLMSALTLVAKKNVSYYNVSFDPVEIKKAKHFYYKPKIGQSLPTTTGVRNTDQIRIVVEEVPFPRLGEKYSGVVANLTDYRSIVDRIQGYLSAEKKPIVAIGPNAEQEPTIIHKSKSMVALLANLKKFAQAGVSPVLFYGETGTGKELLAEYYHYWFRPKSGAKPPLVIINCGAIPDNLIESELFGYKKGSQSQATEDHPGSLAEADNGVVFLDEINSTQPPFQAKLLRFLEKGELQVLGSGASSKRGTDGKITTSRVSVKILAGSNEDARQLVKNGRMRSDFYYRIAGGMTVHVPPLRERAEDVPLLLQFFFDDACRRAQKQLRLTDRVSRELAAHPWDNIRPMASFIEKLVGVTLDGETLNELPFLPDPPLELGTAEPTLEREDILEAICGRSAEGLRYEAMVESFERFVIEPELKANAYNVKETARKLGMARTTLVDTLKRLKLQ